VDDISYDFVKGATVDYEEELIRSAFVVSTNPSALTLGGRTGTPSSLAEKMDFSIGRNFEQKVRLRFGAQVHHAYPSPRGSFFLLATFRRYPFRLTEESVALALQS